MAYRGERLVVTGIGGESNFRRIQGGADYSVAHDRDLALAEWERAKPRIIRYPGSSYEIDGVGHRYGNGRRLEILGRQVMDTCETPWANRTVHEAFKKAGELREQRGLPQGPIGVLERGYGLGITAQRVSDSQRLTSGGSYDVIELNRGLAEKARAWENSQNLQRALSRTVLPGQLPRVPVRIYEGDATVATRKRAQKVASGREKPADIIISDTYPQEDEEPGFNDIRDLDAIVACLDPKTGVFTFFAYFPGAEGGPSHTQRVVIERYFKNYEVSETDSPGIVPPREYRYLWTPDGRPVTRLPVVICWNPR